MAKIKAAKHALEQREEQLNPGKVIQTRKEISFADTDAYIATDKVEKNHKTLWDNSDSKPVSAEEFPIGLLGYGFKYRAFDA